MPMPPANDSDLDRTDELPLLDLAVCQASPQTEDVLSSTDTWAVQELQDLVDAEAAESTEPTAHLQTAPRRHGKPLRPGSVDLSVNVDGLLNRIAELEAAVTGSHAANAELEAQRESLLRERATLEQRLAAVEAGYARIEEQRAMAREQAERLERQLHDQAEQHHTRLAEVEAARAADQIRAQQERAALERQIEQATANFSGTVDEHARLRAALEESLALAATRAARIDELQQALVDEETAAYTLSRNLAAKLADHDVLASAVAQRDATIAALERAREEFTQQLQQSSLQTSGEVERLTRELQEASTHHDELARARAELAAKTAELTRLTEQLTSLETDRATLWSELETQSNLVHALQEELASAHRLNETLEGGRSEAQQSLQQAQLRMAAQAATLEENAELLQRRHDELDAAKLELDRQTAHVSSLEQALQARDKLIEDLRAMAKSAQEERAATANNLSKARVRIKAMAQRILTADEQIETLRSELAVHTEALASIRRDIERAGRAQHGPAPADAAEPVLEPLNHPGASIRLSSKIMTLGRSEDSDIPLDSKLVSRYHARLLVGPTGVIIEDCGSTNGCFVNGQQVKQHVLREGDVLALGELKFRLGMQPAIPTLERSSAVR